MGQIKNKIRQILTRVYLAYTAGMIAAVVQSVIIWFFGQIGLFILVRLPLAPALTPAWFYQRAFWGGMWGVVFLLPVLRGKSQWKRGLLMGLFPSLATLLYFLPFKDGFGFFGLELGIAMPFVVVFFGIIWGVLAGFFLGKVAPSQQKTSSPEIPPDGK